MRLILLVITKVLWNLSYKKYSEMGIFVCIKFFFFFLKGNLDDIGDDAFSIMDKIKLKRTIAGSCILSI